jgi:hypothetical protein
MYIKHACELAITQHMSSNVVAGKIRLNEFIKDSKDIYRYHVSDVQGD